MYLSLRYAPKRYIGLILALFLLAIGYTFLINLAGDENSITIISDLFSLVFNILATTALCLACLHSRKRSNRLAVGWGFLAFAQFLFALGDLIWSILEVGLKISPFPSLADGAYLLFYVFFFVGVFWLPSEGLSANEWLKRVLDIGIIMLSATIGYWAFLIGPIIQSGDASSLETILSIAYPVGDLLLLFALMVIVYLRPQKINIGSIGILSMGVVVQIVSDSMFSYQSLYGTYQAGGTIDALWIASYIIVALAGIHQAISVQNYQDGGKISSILNQAREKFLQISSYMPYGWVIAAYFLIRLKVHDPSLPIGFDELFIGVGTVILFVILRQVIGISENSHLLANLKAALDQLKIQANELDRSNTNLREEISVRNQVEAKLAHDALHDSLTGLANRSFIWERLERAIDLMCRNASFSCSVLFLDLDDFKTINDGLGHASGDQVLIEVGKRLIRCIRTKDTAARLGGDEFVILLENVIDEDTIHAISQRILAELHMPIVVGPSTIQLTCSIGVIRGIKEYTNPDDILRDVDIAMYQAKGKGKARYEVFNWTMREAARSQLATENELRRALVNGEFALHYQPIYRLPQRKMVGVEALVRWDHPTRGLLPPAQFIEIAEKSGLILQVGEWVLAKACAQLKSWQIAYPYLNDLVVNVNISGKQINQKEFPARIKDILLKTGLDPMNLKLEVTENVFIDNLAVFNELILDLRRIGVTFMIDDFGTGYSSLNYLKEIPVNTVKIDKSFVDGIADGKVDFEIIRAIIQMTRGLDMDTIAEGIENQAQLSRLITLDCKYGQGFYLSKPMDALALEENLGQLNAAL